MVQVCRRQVAVLLRQWKRLPEARAHGSGNVILYAVGLAGVSVRRRSSAML